MGFLAWIRTRWSGHCPTLTCKLLRLLVRVRKYLFPWHIRSKRKLVPRYRSQVSIDGGLLILESDVFQNFLWSGVIVGAMLILEEIVGFKLSY